jgi:hypothetical protein
VDGVGEFDDGVDGADAEGGVGLEVEDARDVLEGAHEGGVGFEGLVLAVGGADGFVPGLDVGLVEPEESFEGVFFTEVGEGHGVAAGAEEEGESLAVLAAEHGQAGESRCRMWDVGCRSGREFWFGGGEHGQNVRVLTCRVNAERGICLDLL